MDVYLDVYQNKPQKATARLGPFPCPNVGATLTGDTQADISHRTILKEPHLMANPNACQRDCEIPGHLNCQWAMKSRVSGLKDALVPWPTLLSLSLRTLTLPATLSLRTLSLTTLSLTTLSLAPATTPMATPAVMVMTSPAPSLTAATGLPIGIGPSRIT